MDLLQAARKALEEAETVLRGLAAEAAKLGRYEDVQVLARWAKRLAELQSADGVPSIARNLDESANGEEMTTDSSDGYPRFFRHGESIVKVGWSKAKAERYEHRAPLDVVVAVIAALSRAGARKRPIAVEALMPLRSRDNKPIPNYQVYVALSLLRAAAVIEQHGRRGYALAKNPSDPVALATQLWDSLPYQEGSPT